MKRLTSLVVAIGLAAGSTAAFAQSSNYYPPANDYNRYQQGEAYYDYARVIRVDPVLDGSSRTTTYNGQRCYETTTASRYERDGYYGNPGYRNDGYYDPYNRSPQYGSNTGRNVATIVGGVAGAVLGSKIGGGSGSYAASAIGSMVGGMAGRTIYDRSVQPRRGQVTVCDPVVRGTPVRGSYGDGDLYDVTYEYGGRRYTSRMNYNPGDRVRVRVDVTPE